MILMIENVCFMMGGPCASVQHRKGDPEGSSHNLNCSGRCVTARVHGRTKSQIHCLLKIETYIYIYKRLKMPSYL